MARERITVDVEYLMVELFRTTTWLTDGVGHVEVRSETDVDTVDVLPMIVVSPGQGQKIDGGPALAWTWVVHFSVVHNDHEVLSDLCDEIYEKMHRFEESWTGDGTIIGTGTIDSVEDISVFTRSATTTTPAGDLTQYDGTFSVVVKKA